MKNYLSTIKDNIVYHNDMNKFVFKNFNENVRIGIHPFKIENFMRFD